MISRSVYNLGVCASFVLSQSVHRLRAKASGNIMSFDNTLTRLSSSDSVASPLRKKSVLALANTKETVETVINDDDAERRELRRKSLAPDPATTPAAPDPSNRRKSLGLGACSGLSSAQLAEHYASCIKLSTENKITVKNAFSLQLIDYMSMMLKRHDNKMEDFQVASCTLDASTKIYSFRVDAVHSDVVQMASNIGRVDTNKKKRNTDDGGDPADGGGMDNDDDDDDDGPQSQALKKLKKKSRKHKSALADKPESLKRKQQIFQTMDPFLVRLSARLAVSQSGECPFHHALKHRDSSDSKEKAGKSAQEILVELPPIPDFSNLEICPSFRDFTFAGWVPENDPRPSVDLPPPPPPPPQNSIPDLNDDHVFDMNQTPEPIPDVDFGAGVGGCDGLDSDDDEYYAAPDARIRAAAKLGRQPANVVDLKEHLSNVPLEYSYFQQSTMSLWAGPAHWKVKPLRKDKEKDVAVTKQAKKRTRKELELNFHNDTNDIQKYFGSAANKLNKKTIQGWSADRLRMPDDIHYDVKRITSLFLRECISVKASDDSAAPEVDEGVGDYQYDNPTDRTSFCPNVPAGDDDDDDHHDNGADLGDGMGHEDDDMFQTQDVHAEMEGQEHEIGAFTGDNLIAAPNKVAKIYIPYQMRAKKMDMKKLKATMWSVLTETPEFDHEDIQVAEKSRMEATITFSKLYDTLPNRLPPKMTENLSCPLAFVGLLHLANEKCLDIKGVPDLNDLLISQG